MNKELETMPHVATKIDMHAFNALAVMGLIEGFHAGRQIIFILPENEDLIATSSPAIILLEMGWTFRVIDHFKDIKLFIY